MPPRPPVTTLVIHTWKEHGKPRPLSNQEQSTQAARDRISRSLSYDSHLAAHVKYPEEEHLTHPHRPAAVIRSTSVEEALNIKYAIVSSPLSSNQPSDDDSDTSFGVLPILPRCIAKPSSGDLHQRSDDVQCIKQLPWEDTYALPPRLPLPAELPPAHPRHMSQPRGIPITALRFLEHPQPHAKGRRVRARSLGTATPFETSLLGECMIKASSSFEAGLSNVAHCGVVQSAISPNM